MELNDIVFLIGSYLAVADSEINDKEHKVLLQKCNPTEEAIRQQALIYSDSESKILLDDLIDEYKTLNADHDFLLETLFQAEYADNYPSPYEDVVIAQVVRRLNIPDSKIVEFRQKYERPEQGVLADVNLTWSESLTAAFKGLVTELKGNDEDDYAELLSGKAFAKKLREIAKTCQQDLRITEDIMTQYNDRIKADSEIIAKNIKCLEKRNRNDKEIEDLVSDIIRTNEWIQGDVCQALHDNLLVLEKKKRSVDYFTIVFMGRTKSGKSTFHKVVTHEENDDIGVGKLRTTRYNRSFYWENIRIVDTPGIGAPGGKKDTETASSIIDEADLICYIVMDDSIQTTEFDFLSLLKERSKPLFIILNIKGELEDHPKRLSKFIKNPLRWRDDSGNDAIQGHYDRIYQALGDKYDMSMVEIVPVHVYAALIMNQDRFSDEEKSQLMLGSNIKEYVQKVKKTIYRTGSLKKTQNIYDGCAYQVNHVKSGLEAKYISINNKIRIVGQSLKDIMTFIDKESRISEERISKAISNSFQQMRINAKRFTDSHYDDKRDLSAKWNNDPDNKRISKNLSNTLNQISSDLNECIVNRIKECLSDMEIYLGKEYSNNDNHGISGSSVVDYQLGVRIGGHLLALLATFFGKVLLSSIGVPVPVAEFIGPSLGLLVEYISGKVQNLFKSKDRQIAEAKEKLYSALLDSIDANESAIYDEYLEQFACNIEKIKSQLDESFRFVIEQSQTVSEYLKRILEYSERYENSLSALFAYRTLRYLREISKMETDNDINLDMVHKHIIVSRSYKDSSMTIKKPAGIPSDMLDLASQVTQIKFTN